MTKDELDTETKTTDEALEESLEQSEGSLPNAEPVDDSESGEQAEITGADANDEADEADAVNKHEADTGETAKTAPNGIVVTYYGLTDVGLIREQNEDNLTLVDMSSEVRDLPGGKARTTEVGDRGLLLAVCDGMGGAAAGEVASQMAVDTIHGIMQGADAPEDRDLLAHRLIFSIEEAGTQIYGEAKRDRSRGGMGTTATAAALIDEVLFLGQVGDSRCYLLRDGKLSLLTKDQSLVNQLIEAGQLTEEEGEAYEHSNIILQALGTTEDVVVDLTFVELRRGDRIMLCSDGLSGLVHKEMIREVLAEEPDLESAAKRLVELANAGGGHDNITCIVADFDGDGLPPLDLEAGIPEYTQYPLPPLNGSLRTTVPLPTPTGHVSEPVAQTSAPAGEATRSSMVPLVVGLLVAAAVVGAFLLVTGGNDEEPEERPQAQVIQSNEDEVENVRVEVITDATSAELFVNDENLGPLDTERSNFFELEEGAYRFEARVGGSTVAAELVTIEPGAYVELLMPVIAAPDTGPDTTEGDTAQGDTGEEAPTPSNNDSRDPASTNMESSAATAMTGTSTPRTGTSTTRTSMTGTSTTRTNMVETRMTGSTTGTSMTSGTSMTETSMSGASSEMTDTETTMTGAGTSMTSDIPGNPFDI